MKKLLGITFCFVGSIFSAHVYIPSGEARSIKDVIYETPGGYFCTYYKDAFYVSGPNRTSADSELAMDDALLFYKRKKAGTADPFPVLHSLRVEDDFVKGLKDGFTEQDSRHGLGCYLQDDCRQKCYVAGYQEGKDLGVKFRAYPNYLNDNRKTE